MVLRDLEVLGGRKRRTMRGGNRIWSKPQI